MFRAIGVGYAQSLPSAAALNWVLKDGLGRLSRCIYTACVGSAFDTNLKGILLSLREGAGMNDVIMGLLQACYIRKAILSHGEKWENIVEASDVSHTIFRQWFDLLQNSKHSVQNDLNLLQDQIISSGWTAKNVLLSTQEQARYDFCGR